MRYADLIKGFLLVALLPVMTACGNDDEILSQSESKQSMQINITRATENGDNLAWTNDDKVGLSIKGFNETTATNHTLTYNNGSWSASPAIGKKKLPATVEAWYPSTASASEFSFEHDYNEQMINYKGLPVVIIGTVNQSTAQDLAKSDWMTSDKTNMPSPSFDINMQHRLCKVTVNIQSSETAEEVIFFSCLTNTPTGATSVNPNFVGITPLKSDKGNTYTAIVSAFYYNGDSGFLSLMKVKMGKTESLVNLPRNIGMQGSLSAGNAYTFNLTVNSTNSIGTRTAGTSDCELELVSVTRMNNN